MVFSSRVGLAQPPCVQNHRVDSFEKEHGCVKAHPCCTSRGVGCVYDGFLRNDCVVFSLRIWLA